MRVQTWLIGKCSVKSPFPRIILNLKSVNLSVNFQYSHLSLFGLAQVSELERGYRGVVSQLKRESNSSRINSFFRDYESRMSKRCVHRILNRVRNGLAKRHDLKNLIKCFGSFQRKIYSIRNYYGIIQFIHEYTIYNWLFSHKGKVPTKHNLDNSFFILLCEVFYIKK